ncbi:hypothetical protein ZWY2020_047797 [Hordeum vulgare]|nr:hypothetical protein ZWY2020_047797 [Hordeum vulgare]
MKVEKVLGMATGDGENSYAANSRTPAIRENMPLLRKAVEQVYTSLSPASMMVIADLGCSSGPNALLIAAEVIGMISDCNQKTNEKRDMELQFFLNDLPSNDFNLVFQSLDELHNVTRKDEANDAAAAPYFIARMPGSFYTKLFPKQSVHLFHSSYSLHWLSKVLRTHVALFCQHWSHGEKMLLFTLPTSVLERIFSSTTNFRINCSFLAKRQTNPEVHDSNTKTVCQYAHFSEASIISPGVFCF